MASRWRGGPDTGGVQMARMGLEGGCKTNSNYIRPLDPHVFHPVIGSGIVYSGYLDAFVHE